MYNPSDLSHLSNKDLKQLCVPVNVVAFLLCNLYNNCICFDKAGQYGCIYHIIYINIGQYVQIHKIIKLIYRKYILIHRKKNS